LLPEPLRDEPLLSLCIVGAKHRFAVGDELVCEYQIDAVEAAEIQAVEASILWHTEGKGDDDLGVHFFERRLPATPTTAICGPCAA